MSKLRHIYGFHAVIAQISENAASINQIYFDQSRRDIRMQNLLQLADRHRIKIIASNDSYLNELAQTHRHQGLVALCAPVQLAKTMLEVLDSISDVALLLVLDGITDPHNLGACLRVANAAGVHAVIAPRDKSAPINATVEKVASGAVQTTPYVLVTNLARTLRELKEAGIWIVGTAEEGTSSIYQTDFKSATALVMGAEGNGLRRLTKENCDFLVHIPMMGKVESLNVSVASGVCLYEAIRQRQTE